MIITTAKKFEALKNHDSFESESEEALFVWDEDEIFDSKESKMSYSEMSIEPEEHSNKCDESEDSMEESEEIEDSAKRKQWEEKERFLYDFEKQGILEELKSIENFQNSSPSSNSYSFMVSPSQIQNDFSPVLSLVKRSSTTESLFVSPSIQDLFQKNAENK